MIPPNNPVKLSSPVFTLAVVSPLLTGVFTVLSTVLSTAGVLGVTGVLLTTNPSTAFVNTVSAFATYSLVAFSLLITFSANTNASLTFFHVSAV